MIMARLDYDTDNLSGRYTRTNDVIEITGNVFSLEIDDYKKTLYLFGEIDIDICMLNQQNAQRWGKGSYVEFYVEENKYHKTIQRCLNKGYTITNN